MENKPDRKLPFDIDVVIPLVRKAVSAYPPAALFQLSDEGFGSPFEQLVACVISIRTMDEQTLVTARKLFGRARTPEEMLKLTAGEIDELIHNSSFPREQGSPDPQDREPGCRRIRGRAAVRCRGAEIVQWGGG